MALTSVYNINKGMSRNQGKPLISSRRIELQRDFCWYISGSFEESLLQIKTKHMHWNIWIFECLRTFASEQLNHWTLSCFNWVSVLQRVQWINAYMSLPSKYAVTLIITVIHGDETNTLSCSLLSVRNMRSTPLQSDSKAWPQLWFSSAEQRQLSHGLFTKTKGYDV